MWWRSARTNNQRKDPAPCFCALLTSDVDEVALLCRELQAIHICQDRGEGADVRLQGHRDPGGAVAAERQAHLVSVTLAGQGARHD